MYGFVIIIVLALIIKPRITQTYCLYGDQPGCAFQCHCRVASECGDVTSECPSGCANGPLRHNWRGPGCQIGNIGLHKKANASGEYADYPPGGAIDGIIPDIKPYYVDKHCSIPVSAEGQAAEWWTDLGGLYKIYNITIYGRRDCCQERLQQFNLNVYNKTDNKVLCAYHGPVINTYATMECTEPRVGQFVHFIRVGGTPVHEPALCEVVIIGHKVIDCSRCPSIAFCSNITGCTQCLGSYQPDCSTECETGFYGINCAERCGSCKSNTTCDKENGECPNGCKPGYHGSRCVETCPKNCMNNICSDGGNCTEGCTPGYYGSRCVEKCSENCMNNTCYIGGECSEGCKPGYHGSTCMESCPENCTNNICSGEGDCTEGCKPGYYGSRCVERCPENCMNNICSRGGNCTEGCFPGFYGSLCNNSCPSRCSSSNCSVGGSCMNGCVSGYYGTTCSNTCSTNCLNNAICQDKDGVCSEGCQIWWADATCMTYIETPNRTDEATDPPDVSGDSVRLKWQPIQNMPTNLTTFYYYSIQYKIQAQPGDYTENGTVPFSPEPIYTISHLQYDTEYEVKISPFRQFRDERVFGASYEPITFKTKPNKPTIIWPIIVGIVLSVAVMVAVILAIVFIRRRSRKKEQSTNDGAYATAVVGGSLESADSFRTKSVDSSGTKTEEAVNYHKSLTAPVALVPPMLRPATVSKKRSVVSMYPDPSPTIVTREIEESMYANSGVAVVNFPGYVKKRKINIDELFAEYKGLPQADLERCETALLEENKGNNRFRNVYAYDETRVKLHGNRVTDYINANYITGYTRSKEYIATQGTKDHTIVDFWIMLWQEKSNRIIVVANVDENGKRRIDPYWPDAVRSSMTHGDFNIVAESVDVTADYTTRVMTVTKDGETRTIYQLHFTTWEDKSLPVHGAMTLLAFYRQVHSFDVVSHGPMIVHCSAGVGRTGTFIALDILMQMADKEKSLDVYSCVQRLRQERMFMVQTKEQYVFLFDALVDFITLSDTSHKADRIQNNVGRDSLDQTTLSAMNREFKLLCEVKQRNQNQNKDGLSENNIGKNRNADIIPDDKDRLHISGRENYINAIYVDSYRVHNEYVVTQMPLPETSNHFWKLVIEQNIKAIVMLNTDEESIPSYLPSPNSPTKTFPAAEIKLLKYVDVDRHDDIIVQDLQVKEIQNKKCPQPLELTVRHFHLRSWPDDTDSPPDRSHILDLLDLMQSWRSQNDDPDDKFRTIIHCRDGGSHCGMFCGASFVLEKLKAEQQLDAFLAARYVSKRRPEFFSKLVEYQFLYQIVVDSMAMYSEYANVM